MYTTSLIKLVQRFNLFKKHLNNKLLRGFSFVVETNDSISQIFFAPCKLNIHSYLPKTVEDKWNYDRTKTHSGGEEVVKLREYTPEHRSTTDV